MHEQIDQPEYNSNPQVSAGVRAHLKVTEAFAQQFLEQLGEEVSVRIRVGTADEFASPSEHFEHRKDGSAIISDVMYEKMSENSLLMNSIVLHELYHNVRHGFGSYAEAIEIIDAFNVSDIVRIDLEADLVTYDFLKEQVGFSYRAFVSQVMLKYSDLFGLNNKSFADFSRFCGKLFTLSGQIGAEETDGAVVFLATNENGWKVGSKNVSVRVQLINDESVRFQTIEFPKALYYAMRQIFWGGADAVNQALQHDSTGEVWQKHQEQVDTLLSFISKSKFSDSNQ